MKSKNIPRLVISLKFFLILSVAVCAEPSVELGLRDPQNVDSGVVVELRIDVPLDSKNVFSVPAWALNPSDFLSGAFVLESQGVEMGRIDSQDFKKWRGVRSKLISLPAGSSLCVRFILAPTHEIFQYKMDKSIVENEILIYHEFWPRKKVKFVVKEDGALVLVKSNGEKKPVPTER